MRVRDFHRNKVAITRSKTGSSRDVVLTEEGASFFERLTAGRPQNALIFQRVISGAGPDRGADRPRPMDRRPWGKSDQNRPMKEACENAKINPPVGFHALRHTWASLAVMNAMPLMVVARNLGHKDTRMVERHYGHLSAAYVDDMIRASAPRFGAVESSTITSLRR